MIDSTKTTILDLLHNAGLDLSITQSGMLGVSPSDNLNDHLRNLIRENRAVLIECVLKADEVSNRVQMPDPHMAGTCPGLQRPPRRLQNLLRCWARPGASLWHGRCAVDWVSKPSLKLTSESYNESYKSAGGETLARELGAGHPQIEEVSKRNKLQAWLQAETIKTIVNLVAIGRLNK